MKQRWRVKVVNIVTISVSYSSLKSSRTMDMTGPLFRVETGAGIDLANRLGGPAACEPLHNIRRREDVFDPADNGPSCSVMALPGGALNWFLQPV